MAGERVLVVDDEQYILDVLEHFLEAAGYKVTTTEDPEEALSLAREQAPDAVLLDILMPRMDGFDLCQMLRDHPQTKDVPIVFVTALGDEVSRMRGRVSGGTAYLQKPFTKSEILEAVHAAVTARKKITARRRKR
ncbi:MAG: response regulator [Planctomycetota bacterium]|jgi:two-component system alkaline phosphatase synthesis response regulator PhoP